MKIILSVLFLFLTGCMKEKEETKQQPEENIYNNNIPVVDEVWLKDRIEKRNGKILFVNFWATWCQPCVEEFPDLVKIYNEFKNSDFEFLSVSVDLASEIETKVKPFLSEQKADFNVVVIEEKRSEQVINLINPEWNGAVPVTVIYDKDGEMKEFISEAKDYDAFHSRIESVKSL